MHGYTIDVMADHKSPRTGRICKTVQDWIAYVTKPDGSVEAIPGWSSKKQAIRIATEYILGQVQRNNQET